MAYGINPYNLEKGTIYDIFLKLRNNSIIIPRIKEKNKPDIILSEGLIHLLQKMLQKDNDNRITWQEFFYHPWIITKNIIIKKIDILYTDIDIIDDIFEFEP